MSTVFEVTISIGEPAEVTLHVNDNLLDTVDAGVSGRTLSLGLKPGTSVRDATLRADVRVPTLAALEASGASEVRLTATLPAERLDVRLSGAARLEAPLRLETVEVELSGSSQARLTGRAERGLLRASGASSIDAGHLDVGEVEVDCSGASSATVHTSRSLAASASGASSVRYRGQPANVRRQTSGASSVSRSS